MGEILGFASSLGRVLILATLVVAASRVWKTRDRHRLDILTFIGCVAIQVWLQLPSSLAFWNSTIRFVALAAQPYLVFRLVMHFAAVPTGLRWTAVAMPPAVLVALLVVTEGPRRLATYSAVYFLSALVVSFGALLMTRAVWQAAGVTRRRLAYAAAGTWSLVAGGLAVSVLPETQLLGDVLQGMTGPLLFCYFLAFATPRRLADKWQRAEQAKYLTFIATREPQQRGALAAQDLNQAAVSSVANAVTFVALHPPGDPSRLRIEAARDEALVGLMIEQDDGLVANAFREREPRQGRSSDVRSGLAERLARYGQHVIVAPVATAEETWGVVVAVQRRGTLFPEDDLRLLAELGRHAGTALDHAQLVNAAQDRERRSAERKLREVESRMSLMLDSIKDYAMMILDHRGRVVSWPVGSSHVFGWSSREIVDEPAAPLYAMTNDQLAVLLDEARELGRARREGPCRRRDGETFIGSTIIRPLEVEEEGLRGYVAVTRDVTERRRLEEQLRQGQKMEAIGQLAGGIAHDFNNLLTAILGYSDWLMSESRPDDPRRQQLGEIQKAAERAAGLTRHLLTFSRGQMVEPEVVNLNRLVTDLLPMLRRVIGEHIAVVGDSQGDVLPVLADPTEIEQLVLNLAVNARDAMPDGGTLTISTRGAWVGDEQADLDIPPGQYVVVEVNDTGVGMDEATKARIFEPFFTTKDAGHGTGLGLATVYGIVRQMGGQIRVDSHPGQGATFRLHLPATSKRTSFPLSKATEALAGHERVLLVEDDPSVRQFVKQVLEQHGYSVLEATDAPSALALVHRSEQEIELILTDVIMPRGTGPELVRSLAQVLPGVPALFISGYADAAIGRQVPFQRPVTSFRSHFQPLICWHGFGRFLRQRTDRARRRPAWTPPPHDRGLRDRCRIMKRKDRLCKDQMRTIRCLNATLNARDGCSSLPATKLPSSGAPPLRPSTSCSG